MSLPVCAQVYSVDNCLRVLVDIQYPVNLGLP